MDAEAASILFAEMRQDRPISLVLLERLEDRRKEVVALAIRSLGHLGYYEPFVDALNDAGFRSRWSTLYRDLMSAVARSPDTAKLVRVAFERNSPDNAANLFRMLWGYSVEQLVSGTAQDLVENLESRSLDVRVLAYENLDRITGRTHLFLPWSKPHQQRTPLAAWQAELKAGTIAYKNAPSPFDE